MAPDPYKSNIIDTNSTKRIQSIVGNILYYARSVDPTILREINEIPRVQSRPIRDTEEKSRILIDYAATYLHATICYKASDMVLHMDSYAAYLTMTEARRFYAGNFYLGDWPSPSPIKTNPKINDSIHTECKTIRNVVYSSSESETCGTFKNGKKDICMWPDLIALDHEQPATPLKTENYTTCEF